MEERLSKIIELYGLSATELADKINVQPSAISHLLSGRNKPSFDMLQRLLGAFPTLNPEWLIMGIGEIEKSPAEEAESRKQVQNIGFGSVEPSNEVPSPSLPKDTPTDSSQKDESIGLFATELPRGIRLYEPTLNTKEIESTPQQPTTHDDSEVEEKVVGKSTTEQLFSKPEEDMGAEINKPHGNEESKSTIVADNRQIERIILLYNDGTFQTFQN